MRNPYPTTNPLDRSFLGVASLVIVASGAVALCYCAMTMTDVSPYQAALTTHVAPANSTTRTVPRGSAPISSIAYPLSAFVSAGRAAQHAPAHRNQTG